MSERITVEEWLAELERITRNEPEGMTVAEIADATGIAARKLRDRIRVGIKSGACRCVGRKSVTSIDGRVMPSPAYQFSRPSK